MKRTLYIAGGFTLAFLMPFNLQAQNTQPKDTNHEPHGRRRTGI